MSRRLIVLMLSTIALPMWLVTPSDALSQEQKSAADEKPSPEDALKADPDDLQAWRGFINEKMSNVVKLMGEDKFDEAETALNAAGETAASLKPTTANGESMQTTFARYVTAYGQRIEIGRTPLDDLKRKAEKDPESNLSNVMTKYTMLLTPLVRDKPDDAEKLIEEARAYFESVAEKNPDSKSVKSVMAGMSRAFATYERYIEIAKKHQALIGQDALPLGPNVRAWANGEPISDADLKGKVVLLDFWAIWCGPCIATFPHLNEWNAHYSHDDFQIVGITNYYNYRWDEEQGRPVRPRPKPPTTAKSDDEKASDEADAKEKEKDDSVVTPEEEREMLAKFAKKHSLEHPFAIEKEARTIARHYAVSGIPQAVLIDRKGKVRMIKVGSGDANAAALDAMIEKLVAEKP